MNITTLLILAVILVPGYFIIKRLSRIIYSDDSKFEEKIENHYGFDRLEKQIEENKKENEESEEKGESLRDLQDIEANNIVTESIDEKK